MKKLGVLIFSILLLMNVAYGFDLSQEIQQTGGTIKLDEKMSLDIQDQTFASSVNFTSKTINDIDGKVDTTKYADKNFGAFSLSFQNKSGVALENSKPLTLSIIGLDSYKSPVLLKSNSGTIEEIEGKDDLGSMVFSIEKNPTASYKIVEKLSSTSATTSSLATTSSTDSIGTPVNDTNSTMDNSGETASGSQDISLASKDTKGTNSLLVYILLALGITLTVGTGLISKKL